MGSLDARWRRRAAVADGTPGAPAQRYPAPSWLPSAPWALRLAPPLAAAAAAPATPRSCPRRWTRRPSTYWRCAQPGPWSGPLGLTARAAGSAAGSRMTGSGPSWGRGRSEPRKCHKERKKATKKENVKTDRKYSKWSTKKTFTQLWSFFQTELFLMSFIFWRYGLNYRNANLMVKYLSNADKVMNNEIQIYYSLLNNDFFSSITFFSCWHTRDSYSFLPFFIQFLFVIIWITVIP